MRKIQESIEVNAPIQACYDQWTRFEEYPRFMKHVRSITAQGDNRWHWVIDGPMGKNVEWDAVLDGQAEERVISWHSISDSEVGNQGAVTFEELSLSSTRITVTIQYQPPAGMLGDLVAQIFSNPDAMLRDDLKQYKELMEGALV